MKAPLLLLPFVAGVLLALLIHGRGEESPMPAPSPTPDDSREEPAPDPTPPPEVSSPEPEQELPEVPTLMFSDLPIEGTVVDAAGEPMPDVWIELSARPTRIPASYGESLEDRLRWLVDRDRFGTLRARKTMTGSDGTFYFDELEDDVRYGLRATSPGIRFIGRPRPDRLEPGAFVEFVGTSVVAVPVQVLMPDGSEATEARLTFSSGGRNHGSAWSPDDPVVELEPGQYLLSAEAPPWYQSDRLPVQIDPGRRERISVSMTAPIGIEVRLVGAETLPRFSRWGSSMRCARIDDERSTNLAAGVRGRRQRDAVRFLGLEPGDYLVGFTLPWDQELSREVTVVDGVAEIELVVPPPPAGDLTVWVHEGERLLEDRHDDVKFSIVRSTERGWREERPRSFRHPDGSYAVYLGPELLSQLAEGGPASLKTVAESLGVRLNPLANPLEPTIHVHFEPRALVEVTLEGYEDVVDDIRVSGHLVSREWDDWNSRQRSSSHFSYEPDARGRMDLRSWEATPVWLILAGTRQRQDAYWSGFFGAYPLDLKPGRNRFTVPTPSLHTLKVDFPFTPGGGQVQLYTVVPYLSEQPRLEGSTATWQVPSGTYTVRHYREGDMSVVVNGDTTVSFQGVPPDRLYVQIHDPRGYLARLDLRTGDEIVAFDGQPIVGYDRLKEARGRIQNGATGSLLVERGGGEVTIELRPDLQPERGQVGGRLELRPGR